MYKAFFTHYMENEPTSVTEKYIFIVDNEEVAQAIVMAGFKSVFLANKDSKHQYSLDTFLEYLDSLACKGKCRTDYTYIPACGTKKANDTLTEYFKGEYLKNHAGWKLFKDKEYLANFDKSEELKKVLNGYIKRFEGDNSGTPLDLDKFHILNGEGKAVAPFDDVIAEHIKSNYHMFIIDCPYLYVNGVYIPDRKGTKLKDIIKKYLYPQFRTPRRYNPIYTLIIEADELQKNFDELNCFPKSYVNFQDCMLDVETMQEISHSPDFFSINQIPHKWQDAKRAAEGKEIENFFDFVFPNADDREMFLEYAGYSLTADTRQQRFLTLCGIGGTGKSILIRLLETVAGIANVSNVSMQDLNKRFSTSLLVGKTLNSCADLSGEALEDSSTMKKLLGEDSVMGEFKGQTAFMFKNYSKMLFSTNMLPVIMSERTNGFYRRLLILKMNRQPEKVDIGLADKLLKEIPYFLKLSVQALNKMYQRGVITISEGSKEAVLQMWKNSDVVQAWIDDRCTVGANLKIERGAAFEDFRKYCEIEERRAFTKNGFYEALRGKNYTQTKIQGYWHFKGLGVGKNFPPQNEGKTSPDNFIQVSEEDLKDLPFD